MHRLKSAYVQFALAIASALTLSLIMHLFQDLASGYPTIRLLLAYLTFPAVAFAFLVGGHGPSAFELTLGLVLEFIFIVLVIRLFALALAKLESSLA